MTGSHGRVSSLVIRMAGDTGIARQSFVEQDLFGVGGIFPDLRRFVTGQAFTVRDATKVLVTGFTGLTDAGMAFAQFAGVGHGIGKPDHQPDDGYQHTQYV